MLALTITVKRAMSIAVFSALVASAGGVPYQLTFSGTYTMSTVFPPSDSLFGVSPLPAPFTYTITYDTALDTNTYYFPIGSTIDGKNVLQPFYGYSASGVLGANLTFGTQTWAASDIVWLNPAMTIGAELWFNTDLDAATPTECWIRFSAGTANLDLGSAALLGLGPDQGLGYLAGRSTLSDYAGPSGDYLAFDTTIQRVPLVPMPDQGSCILLCGPALLLLACAHRRWPRSFRR